MKSGEEYEKIAHEVVQALHSDKKVTHNVKILGTLTEVKRQIDVKLDENEYDFIMYECKDWGKSIGVGVVGQLLTDLEDVGAKKGAIIANSPFTKGAVNLATKKGVALLHLVKTDNPKTKVGIAALVLVRENVIDKIAFGVESLSTLGSPYLSMDPEQFILKHAGKFITLNQYIRLRWNDGLNATSSLGENIIEINNPHIIDVKGGEYTVTKITIRYWVKRLYYEGQWVIEEVQGLLNVLDNSFHAYGNMKSGTLSVDDMERTFAEIDEQKAKQGNYSIMLDVTSEYH